MATGSGLKPIVDGLVFEVDAANSRSYAGTGLTTFDLKASASGTLVNGVGFSTSNNGNFIFDGTNDYIDLYNNAAIGITNNISIIIYFKYTSFTTQWQAILTKGDDSYRVHRYSSSDKISFGMNFSGGLDTPSVTSFVANRWYAYAATFSVPNINIYVNGILDTTGTYATPISVSNYKLLMGENAQATGRYFNGNIGQVQIFNRVLSSTEILQNYNATKGRYGL